jgi:very-short-patch-repair endonuclease
MNTIGRARLFRADPTVSEARAWRVLRHLRREGLHVRRQHPIGPYVVNFAIQSRLLAIELDGGVHAQPGRAEKDAQRDAFLTACGWRVVRLPAALAFAPDRLIDAVRSAAS